MVRNDDNHERAEEVMPNQRLSDEVEYYDQYNQMRQKDGEEKEQWNGQNLKKLKYHFEREVEHFQRNETCEMLINVQTQDHWRKDVTEFNLQ